MSRWPVVRHVRWFLARREVEAWYAVWRELGYMPVNRDYDDAHLARIWRGEV